MVKKVAIPIELKSARPMIEGNFVMTLWKCPELFFDYPIDPNRDLIEEDGKFFYSLGYNIMLRGVKSLDELTVFSFISDNPEIQEQYDIRGGYKQIKEMLSIIEEENIESYYDELCKSNLLIELSGHGFDVVRDLDKFKLMTTEDVRDYYEYILESLNVKNVKSGVEIEDLMIDDDFIAECDSGTDMGIPYDRVCPLLNYVTLGIPLGELYMLAGFSGTGKSSAMFEWMGVTAALGGYKACIISNEQRSKEFKKLLLVRTLYEDLKYYNVTRKKLKTGGFSMEDIEYIQKAQKIIKEKYGGKLKFVKLFDYDVNKIKTIVKKLSKEGFQLFIYDTMKGENLAAGEVWQRLVEDSKQLFQLASKENVAILPTYQLALHSLNKRYLDEMCLSNAKQIKEVFSEMVFIRDIWDDEFDGEPYDIKPFRWKKDDTGKYSKIKEYVTLDRDKSYKILFVNKTRNDEGKKQIVYEFNGAWNQWKEIGYCTVRNDHM